MRILSALLMAAALASPAAAETVLIRDGRVVTNGSAGTIEGGDVLIVDGRVSAVGANISAPNGARIVEANGRYVTPGAFAAMSEIGLSEISGSGAPNDADLDNEDISAAADAAQAFNPAVTAVAVTRMEGVTRAAIAPSSTDTIFGGRGALVSMSGAPDSLFRPNAFMVVELGETGANRVGGSRAALWPAFEAALRDAREYPSRYRSGQGGAVLSELDAAALQPFARGQGLFLVHIESAADIRRLIRFKRDNPGLRFAIHGGAEAWQVADELARADIPVIVDPLSNLPDRFERLSARLDNAAILDRAGVTVAIAPAPGTVDAHQARLVLQLAGNAVANGMDWDSAFAAVSRTPAEIFGAGSQVGRLERNYRADVVIWDGDPLQVTSAPDAVFIEGVEQPLVSRQTLLRDRYHPSRR
ncbi:MAG TPA: amidohydrolase family protein [Vitreimonas sp.]|uniref:amidohydrolase family protein n=1 Tax=Vitreimonas sp. TaxID=3069702 RepID=UPI002D2CBE18|nr:amidohydrolase family protein [Vitreimonas sp.]HYD85862.1 amidohydrolase family protein [Vitreimonas sp.]